MDLKIISLSDVHFGHPQVSAMEMFNRLCQYVIPKMKEADIIFICGDLYHTLLHMSAQDARIGTAFILLLMKEAEKYNTAVRILRGTYTHDRDQLKMADIIYSESGFTFDYAYQDTLTVEHIESLKLRVLYIPDNLGYDSSESVMEEIHKLLELVGWPSVDIVCGHGYFDHMLPPNIPRAPKITFRADQFDDLVTKFILMGHVHTKSVKDNIIYNGSFDRLAHGEEEAKGFFFIDKSIHFIENKLATKFKTFDLSPLNGEDKDAIIEEFTKLVSQYSMDNIEGHVRVIHPESEVRQMLSHVCSSKFPLLKYSHKSPKELGSKDTITADVDMEYCEGVVVTEDNLPVLIAEYCTENQIVTDMTLDDIRRLLHELQG